MEGVGSGSLALLTLGRQWWLWRGQRDSLSMKLVPCLSVPPCLGWHPEPVSPSLRSQASLQQESASEFVYPSHEMNFAWTEMLGVGGPACRGCWREIRRDHAIPRWLMLLWTVSDECLDAGLSSPWLRMGKTLCSSWETPKGLLGVQCGVGCGGRRGGVGKDRRGRAVPLEMECFVR